MVKKIHGAKFVAFGDSITEGTGIPEEAQKWTAIIQERFGLELVNSGIGGNTSLQGLQRIKSDVLDHKPDFVTLCFGMNDKSLEAKGKPRVTEKHFKCHMTSMIECVKYTGAVPLLVTQNYLIEGTREEYYYSRHDPEFYTGVGGAQAWLDRYMDIVRELSTEENVGMIDVRRECEKYDPYLFLRSLKNDTYADGVHPYVLGASVYAKTIGDYLEANYC